MKTRRDTSPNTAPASTPAAPLTSATTPDANGTARRAIVVSILRTVPASQLAPLLALLVAWLRAIAAVVAPLRPNDRDDSPAVTLARGMAGAATDALYESEAWSDTENHGVALVAVWLCDSPHTVARYLHTQHCGGVRDALEDIEHARAELARPAAPHPVVRIQMPEGVDRMDAGGVTFVPCAPDAPREVAAILRDAAGLVADCGDEKALDVAYSVCSAISAPAGTDSAANYLDSLAVALAAMAAARLARRAPRSARRGRRRRRPRSARSTCEALWCAARAMTRSSRARSARSTTSSCRSRRGTCSAATRPPRPWGSSSPSRRSACWWRPPRAAPSKT